MPVALESYCSIGYDPAGSHPTKEQPLGVPFPGSPIDWVNLTGLWTEHNINAPNWVGWLVTEFSGGQDRLVYDYAVGGHGVDQFADVVKYVFFPTAGQNPKWAQWFADDTLFVIWIGLNDLASRPRRRDNDAEFVCWKLNPLFEQVEAMYATGARNFLFIHVPPMELTPDGQLKHADGEAHKSWNTLLAEYVVTLTTERKDVKAMVFSYRTFFDIITNPVEYGFEKVDVKQYGGPMWADHIHPTSNMHRFIARDITNFLRHQ
ncbi:hypothetical protein BXZ70DRAFT_1029033 [Cristinia sonorae]|uniref:Carbohydrate esterase family 16 protein n=1 Tax=Cristinia sonorae TaxID=1940300 RepID=A0A8K0XUI1_9AGAR|nr:hypothetical protein BXZ70DRAFT_1029033 [Cristinia sonorae]